MKPIYRYTTILLAAGLLGLVIFLIGQQKPKEQALFLGVDGDPRMRLCDGPKDGEWADPAILKIMALDAPLKRRNNDNAAYRIAVLRPANQDNLAITFTSPKDISGRYEIVRWDGTTMNRVTGTLNQADSASLIFAIEDARIWGKLKPTIETLARAGQATAVIEVRTPIQDRCITTRYDDERVAPLLEVFAEKLSLEPASLPLTGLVAPKASFIPVKPAAPATKPAL
ncbi:hypothetical protein [Candidatus Phycosocius spiralis]|uniref:Methanolan biosynthesis EpsI domain-containing protein n=1 Tax=Candidatus Phycosocius spiralis TaxID=2815099 RepID=A0ABQ4PZ28_9PROT|nr:hypothetical protein [Candidatus Phycosocius spiralis]GIU67929.1 hypothetical protein PsB1_2083 [Candidatus Phycosocius spiralis]